MENFNEKNEDECIWINMITFHQLKFKYPYDAKCFSIYHKDMMLNIYVDPTVTWILKTEDLEFFALRLLMTDSDECIQDKTSEIVRYHLREKLKILRKYITSHIEKNGEQETVFIVV